MADQGPMRLMGADLTRTITVSRLAAGLMRQGDARYKESLDIPGVNSLHESHWQTPHACICQKRPATADAAASAFDRGYLANFLSPFDSRDELRRIDRALAPAYTIA